jgi:hypothetical protein
MKPKPSESMVPQGLHCQVCGAWMEDVWDHDGDFNEELFENPPGHPRTCVDCRKEDNGDA